MARRRLTRGLALLFPALALLASAHELYLRNQLELEWRLMVLAPFWASAGLALALGAGLQRLDGRASARAALWTWYSLGFAFTAWGFLRGLKGLDRLALWALDTSVGALLFLAAWGVGAVAAARRLRLGTAEPPLALLALVLLAGETGAFATRLERRSAPLERDEAAELGPAVTAGPNVYHVILDAFQDELFEASRPAETEVGLRGFVRYHATTSGHATAVVLPTVFSGRLPAGPATSGRLAEALGGERSLLPTLRRAGYLTLGYGPGSLYADHRRAFGVFVQHEENSRPEDRLALHAQLFRRLWAFQVMPLALAGRLARHNALGLDAEFLRSLQAQRLSTYAQPIVSRLSLERVLEVEARLPPRGRYTLLHLLLPHNPYVLRADCGSDPSLAPSDLHQQTACTLRLLLRYLGRLQELGRLGPSVVVIHGDHGSGETLRDGRLEPDPTAADRTLLLVKRAGAQERLRTSPEPARVVDVAPTLAALLGLTLGEGLDGRPLQPPAP